MATTMAPLTAKEAAKFQQHRSRLAVLENDWMEKGTILREIRDRRLYRAQFASFEVFCRLELGMGRTNVNRQLQSTELANSLATFVAIPLREAHVRPLLRLQDRDQQLQAFKQAVDQAKHKKKPLTAVFVTRAVKGILDADKSSDTGGKSSTKAAVLTRITRDLTRGLENLVAEDLDKFGIALTEFKSRWLAANLSQTTPAIAGEDVQ